MAKENLKTSTGGITPRPVQKSAHPDDFGKTRDKLADLAGVSHDTDKRPSYFKGEQRSHPRSYGYITNNNCSFSVQSNKETRPL